MIYLIYRLEGDRGGEDAAAFDSSATWRGYTAARRRRPNAASDERAAMRTEDEDPPTHTFVIYHLYDGSQPEGWYSTPNEVAEGVVECFSAQLRQWLRECILPSLLPRSLPINVWESVPILLSLHATAATETAAGKLSSSLCPFMQQKIAERFRLSTRRCGSRGGARGPRRAVYGSGSSRCVQRQLASEETERQ